MNKYGLLPMMLGLGVGLYFFTFPIIGFNFKYFPGDLGDGRLNLYFLEHAYQYFTGTVSNYWDAPFMYPLKNMIAYSDNLLGSAPIYALFRVLGLDTYTAYQSWFVVVTSLNYISAFYLLKYLFRNNYAAVLGALVFAFSLALQSQITHAQTFPRFAIPLAFLMAVKFGNDLKPKYFFLTLFFVVYQIYCGIYLGFMLVAPVGIYLVFVLVKNYKYNKGVFKQEKWFLKIGASAIANILILLPLMLPYAERKISASFSHFSDITHGLPTLKSYVYTSRDSLVWNVLNETAMDYKAHWNHQIFAGGIATLSFIIGLYFLFTYLVKSKFSLEKISTPLLLILTGAITLLIYLRFNNISAYVVLYFIPGFSSMRVLARIINIELIFFAITTGFILSHIFIHNKRFNGLLFLLAIGLFVIDNYSYQDRGRIYRIEKSEAKERVRLFNDLFLKVPAHAVVSYEPDHMNTMSIYYHLDAMLAAQENNLITVNGYTATCPGSFGKFWIEPNEVSRNIWFADKPPNNDTLYVVKGPNKLEIVPLINPKD